MIELVCFDIDGVLTDGQVYINALGEELKSFKLTEMDAINDIVQLGFLVAAITGESTPIVDCFKKRIKWNSFYKGCKDKLTALRKIEKEYRVCAENICYIGDGKYDIPVIKYVGLGVCPANAIQEVKDVADIVLDGAGGESCIYELYRLLKKMKEEEPKK